jgi:hypothetical protein
MNAAKNSQLATGGTSMILNVAGELKIENPDTDVLKEKLYELLSRVNDAFVILVKSDEENDYMQAMIDGEGTFLVEYREGAAKKHYRVEHLGKEDTFSLFQDYLHAGAAWRQYVAWQDVSCTFSWDSMQSKVSPTTRVLTTNEISSTRLEVVYLLKAGPYYKIGKAKDLGQRVNQIRLQLPYPVEILHSIETDDSSGIENYWHKRFSDKRANGEWFLLTDDDVSAFKSREAM